MPLKRIIACVQLWTAMPQVGILTGKSPHLQNQSLVLCPKGDKLEHARSTQNLHSPIKHLLACPIVQRTSWICHVRSLPRPVCLGLTVVRYLPHLKCVVCHARWCEKVDDMGYCCLYGCVHPSKGLCTCSRRTTFSNTMRRVLNFIRLQLYVYTQTS